MVTRAAERRVARLAPIDRGAIEHAGYVISLSRCRKTDVPSPRLRWFDQRFRLALTPISYEANVEGVRRIGAEPAR